MGVWVTPRKVNGKTWYYVIEEDATKLVPSKKNPGKMVHPRESHAAGTEASTAEALRIDLRNKQIKRKNGMMPDKEEMEAASVTLKEATDNYVQHYRDFKAHGSVRIVKWATGKLLTHFTPGVPVGSVTQNEFLKFRNTLRIKHEINGVIIILKLCKAFFYYCINEKKYIKVNPALGSLVGIEAKKVAKPYEDDEIDIILGYCRSSTPEETQELKDLIMVDLMTGMRKIEISNLTRAWVRPERISVPAEFSKSGDGRDIPITPGTYALCEKYFKKHPTGPLFGWNSGRISQAWKRAVKSAKKAGVLTGRCRFHNLRHTYATQIVNAPSGNIGAAKELLGHGDIKTTDNYYHPKADHLRKVVSEVHYKFMDAPVLRVA